jgi:hypothetical protein
MKFNILSHEEKLDIQKIVENAIDALGGKNHFFHMLEDVREAKQHPLMNKTGKFHFKNGTIEWGKEIFKDKIDVLKEVMRTIHGDNLLDIEQPKLKKQTIKAAKTMVKLQFVVSIKESECFSFSPFKTLSDDYIEIDPLFQVIFFDSIHNTKKILKYK